MRPEDRDAGYLWDMLDAARTVRDFTTGLGLDQYRADRKLQLAVERAIEIIGEAARLVSASFKEQHPEIPWQQIIAQRHVLGSRLRGDQSRSHLAGGYAADTGSHQSTGTPVASAASRPRWRAGAWRRAVLVASPHGAR